MNTDMNRLHEIIETLNKEVNNKTVEIQQLNKENKFYDEQYGEMQDKYKREKTEMQDIIYNLKAEVTQLKAENKRLIEHVIDPDEWTEVISDETVPDTTQ